MHALCGAAVSPLNSWPHVWLQEMVSDVTTLCIRVMRLQGAQVEQLMTADYDMCALPGNRCHRLPLTKDSCQPSQSCFVTCAACNNHCLDVTTCHV